MSWKSTQTSNITIRATVEAMIRTGEVYISGKVVQKGGTNVTGHGGFVGTTAAAARNKSA